MERIDPDSERPSIVEEHKHRYQIAATLSSGALLDCACGIGYGSEILLGQSSITSYTGVDIAPDAIAAASLRYKNQKASFQVADATKLPFPDNSFDTVVSLETLEHLTEPSNVIKEFNRVLKPGGLLIASAPTSEHDDFCEATFGKNPYHHCRFNRESLSSLLDIVGPNNICLSRIVAAAELTCLSSSVAACGPATALRSLGSYIGVARKGGNPPNLKASITPFLNLVEVEAEITKAYDRIVQDRDNSIRSYQRAEEELRTALKSAETMAVERFKTIEAYAKSDAELRAAFKRAEEMIRERDSVIEKFKALEVELHKKLLNLEELLNAIKTNE